MPTTSRRTPPIRRRRWTAALAAGVSAVALVAVAPASTAAAEPATAAPAAAPAAAATRTASSAAGTASSASATDDPTRTRKARASRAHRRTIPLEVWAASPYARMVTRRESGGSCTVVNWAGPYRGRWQMTDQLWRAFGGLAYARHPERAECAEQDAVAYRIWVAAGWAPWGG